MIKYGDIIQLGSHRLMCGDATKIEDVKKLIDGEKINLVLTDPPYGMKCQNKNGAIGKEEKHIAHLRDDRVVQSTCYSKMINDGSQDTARKHYEIIKNLAPLKIIWGGQYFAHFLPVSGGWIFWDKKTGNNDFSDGELAWVSKGKRIRKYEHLWNGVCMGGSYKLNGRGEKARLHPTQKPVELHMKILEDFSKPGDVILDCFGGSGTALIACNEIGRKCLMMELSPDYCEIIKERYEKLTQLTFC
ncbi:MAG: site-specific DNA-methyltransferase [Synergistaceae bacterium]|nr:site-specific DNA-methyltransferase [Synergistaceae bacterium]